MMSTSHSATMAHQLVARRASAHSRDPRAAPVAIGRNVSAPESCQFYGLVNAISQCRVPRSCADCLAKPGCALSSNGKCVDVTSPYEYSPMQAIDFRNTTIANNSAISIRYYHFFLGGTTTYCPANDVFCATCRARFQRLMQSPSTRDDLAGQFCRGDSGCVCIGICEDVGVRAERVFDQDCGQPRPVRTAIPQRVQHQSFTTKRRDPRASLLVTVLNRRQTDETCAYYAEQDVRGCRQPRTCQDCLQKDGCMISHFKCASMDKFQYHRDFRIAPLDSDNSSTNAQSLQFPSHNTSFCPSTDPVCSKCRSKFQTKWPSHTQWQVAISGSPFCVGEDGCVCIEFCEGNKWSAAITDTECSTISNLGRGDGGEGDALLAPMVFSILAWVLLWVLYKAAFPRATVVRPTRPAPASRVLRHMLDEVPAVQSMDLFGWRRYQQTLRTKERELLRGDDLVSPVAQLVDFDFVEPSAPDVDGDDSSAPTTHDPTALASAPVYRVSYHGGVDDISSTSHEDLSSPSAPELEFWDGNVPSQRIRPRSPAWARDATLEYE